MSAQQIAALALYGFFGLSLVALAVTVWMIREFLRMGRGYRKIMRETDELLAEFERQRPRRTR